MTTIYILILALLPVAILLYYIYRKDELVPEPAGQLYRGFRFGVFSCLLSFCLSIPFGLMGLYSDTPVDLSGCVRYAFFGAAIPEECAKLFVLWFLLRKNKYFDEHMDGIVYAVFVSLGFAAFENIMYLFGESDSGGLLTVALVRGLFSIPGHFGFGILMGYYYSLAAFYPKSSVKNKILVLLAPVLAHGIYDSILFAVSVIPELSVILIPLFLFFCHKLWKYGSARIAEHLERDASIVEPVMKSVEEPEVVPMKDSPGMEPVEEKEE